MVCQRNPTLERLEIHPPKIKHLITFMALEALLLPMCAFCAFGIDSLRAHLIGYIGLVFFGVGGAFGILGILRRSWSFALTAQGIEFAARDPKAPPRLVLWTQIEEMGVFSIKGSKMVGIRLFPQENQATVQPGNKVAALWTHGLKTLNRGISGYDVSLSWASMDRSAEATLALIAPYWRAATNPRD